MPPRRGWFAGLDLQYLNPGDPDDRHVLILAEHPELHEVIEAGLDEIDVGGQPMNPRLHITIHEVVADQLWDGAPPDTWETAKRLTDLSYERHEIFHMIGSGVSSEIWHGMVKSEHYDHERFVAALAALPESWEEQRPPAPPPPKYRPLDTGNREARRAAERDHWRHRQGR